MVERCGPGGVSFEKADLIQSRAHSALQSARWVAAPHRLQLVEAAEQLLDRFPFDSVLFPLNFATYLEGNFGPQVIAAAQRRGAGVLALKGMARTRWPEGTAREDRRWKKAWYEPLDDRALASLALRFTLNLPVTAAIPPGHAELFDLALDIARDLRPLSEAELATITEMAHATEPLFRAA